ncbi:MAG: HypC/HybG/HupF family hydrogenase formation chaperone [Desulfovibrio sp.]|jgi:hydrogenase expression/formation protein HypC|nr:HypC/HybG/HupF family hydrogenase formation chaperone [Desulfovibrio sp.]
MCLAIPAEVVELQENDMIRVRVGESDTYLSASAMLLPELPNVGDYLIVHAGFALHTLSHEEARLTLDSLREMAAALHAERANHQESA